MDPAVVENAVVADAGTEAQDEAEFVQGFESGADAPLDDLASTETTDKSNPDEVATTVTETPAAAPAAAVEDPWRDEMRRTIAQLTTSVGNIAKLEHRLSSAEGRIAAVSKGSQAAQAARETGGDAPTQRQIEAAAKGGGEKWKKLGEEWPDWHEALEERLADERAAHPNSAPQAFDVEDLTKQITSRVVESLAPTFADIEATAVAKAAIEVKHPRWKDTINSTDFRSFLNNVAPVVPSAAEIAAVSQSFAQGQEQEGTERVNRLKAAYPEWGKVGALQFSFDPSDAIALIDAFHANKAKTTQQQRNQERLDSAITPKGGGSAPGPTVMDAEAEFVYGFKNAKGAAS